MDVDPVVVNHCSLSLGGQRVLRDVSLTVKSGEFCVLLGPSGAGKSTLLRLLVGLGQPDQGEIVLFGEKLTRTNLARHRRRIGMVHQRFELVPRLGVRANILAGLAPQVSSWSVWTGRYPAACLTAAAAAAHAVGLPEDTLGRAARHLSGGQQQRVGLARALVGGPEVLIADEPVANLDPSLRQEILVLMQNERLRRGLTVVCSLHDASLARQFATRIVALRGGTLVFDGAPSDFTSTAENSLYERAG